VYKPTSRQSFFKNKFRDEEFIGIGNLPAAHNTMSIDSQRKIVKVSSNVYRVEAIRMFSIRFRCVCGLGGG